MILKITLPERELLGFELWSVWLQSPCCYDSLFPLAAPHVPLGKSDNLAALSCLAPWHPRGRGEHRDWAQRAAGVKARGLPSTMVLL